MKEWKDSSRLLLYIGITFGITYLFEIYLVRPAVTSGQPNANMLVSLCMFFPAAGMALTRLVTKEGFKNLGVELKLKQYKWYFLAGWLLPVAAVIFGSVLFFVIFPSRFDYNMGYLQQVYAANNLPFEAEAMRKAFVMQMGTALAAAAVGNFIPCLGEELGWRAYMMPKLLKRFKFLPACLIGGVIWGLWHAPLTVLGHNYGVGYKGYPLTGILAMCCFCVVIGTFFTYISAKSQSCLPAVLGHAMLNGYAAAGLNFTKDVASANPFLGPSATGIIGGSGFIIIAVICVILAGRKGGKEMVGPEQENYTRRALDTAGGAAE